VNDLRKEQKRINLAHLNIDQKKLDDYGGWKK